MKRMRERDRCDPVVECARLPTAMDVAGAAQVSQATVSRALRGDRGVSSQTREYIVRVAEELGYRPDSRAVRLREGSVGTIALVLLFADGEHTEPLNPFCYDIVCAVEAAAARRNINVLLSGQSCPSSLRGDFERRREADGIILIGTTTNKPAWDFFAQLRRDGANLVCWGAPDDSLPTIRADNRSAGKLAATHLISSGRRRLAFVGPGWHNHKAFRDRREGFLAEIEREGLRDCSVELSPAGLDRHQQGERAIEALQAIGRGIDGVFAASDVLAAGVMHGLCRNGRRVPEDVAIVGFDGCSASRHYLPTLTSIEQEISVAGELLVDVVLGRGSPLDGDVQPVVPVRLVIRESSRPYCDRAR